MRSFLLAATLASWASLGAWTPLAVAQGQEPKWFTLTGEVTRILVLRGEPASTGRRIGEIPAGANGIENKGCRGPSDASWEHLSSEMREAMAKERWCRVRWRTSEGWVSARFLRPGSPPDATDVPQAVATAPAAGTRRSPPPSTASFTGVEWRAATIGGLELADSPVWIKFAETGDITGHTGCNAFRGSFVAGATALRIGPLAMTRMACQDESRNQLERALVAALETVEAQQVEGGVLRLFDNGGAIRLLLRPK